MSEPIDSESIEPGSFDEYLGRESQVSKRYRALDADEVPAELDSLVLAQARQAVAAKSASVRKKPTWMRWTPPLALAASMVLVISIVIESGTQHEVTTRDMAATMPPSAPAPQSAPAPVMTSADDSPTRQRVSALPVEGQQLSALEPKQSVAAPKSKARQMQARKKAEAAPRQEPVTVELKQSVVSPAFMPDASAPTSELQAAPVPADAVPPAIESEVPAIITAANVRGGEFRRADSIKTAENDAASLQEVTVTGASRAQTSRSAGQGAGPRGTVTSPSAGSSEASEEDLAQAAREGDPKLWLEYIRELRRQNKGRQADREWRNFTKAYPDYAVDEKDVARARQ